MGAELQLLQSKKDKIDKKANKQGHFYRILFGGYLVGQLGLVIHLTYELGWDLMEPVTYLIGLGSSILTFGVYIFTKSDFAFESHGENWLEKKRDKLYEKEGVDVSRIETIEKIIAQAKIGAWVNPSENKS